MSSRPEFAHKATSATIAAGDASGKETVKGPSTRPISEESLNEKSGNAPEQGTTVVVSKPKFWDRHLYDFLLICGILLMLAWPWVFFGVVFGLHGIQASNHFATVIMNNPHTTNFFVTLIGNIITLLIDILFSFAIIRFAQEWIADNNMVTVFHVSLISGFRYRHWPWKIKDISHLGTHYRWLSAALVAGCITCFTFVPSGITSLINPVPFNRTATLEGTELDFSSSTSECLNFLTSNQIPNNCDWRSFGGLNYTNCLGENQMVDVLEAGRGNILSLLPNNNQSLSLSQLGASGGLRFLGPIRGILPIGPDGVPAFNTLKPSPFSQDKERAGMISYNYTLDYQGVSSNISCVHDTHTPIAFGRLSGEPLVNPLVVRYNGTCDGMDNVFGDQREFTSINSNNTLAYWACKSRPIAGESPTYYMYLRGVGSYAAGIGNMTCTASPIQPAIFPVVYQSREGVFMSRERTSTSSFAFSGILDRAVIALGGIVWEAQNWESNLVAESVITFGVKSFNLPPYTTDSRYLPLYEAMIQGILEYEATYTRLIYSTVPNPPPSCTRSVNGATTFEVIGWSMEVSHIGFLMPITLVNLAALGVIIAALIIAKTSSSDLDPTDTRLLLAAYVQEGQSQTNGANDLGHIVSYRRKEAIKEAANKLAKGEIPEPDELMSAAFGD